MTTPHSHEITRLQRQLDAAELELSRRAEIVSEQADELARLRRELSDARAEVTDAVQLGTGFATLGRAFPGSKSFPIAPDDLLPNTYGPVD